MVKSFILNNKLISFLILILVLISLYSFVSPFEYTKTDITNLLSPPSFENLLGTDELGRDILTRLSFSVRTSIIVGTVVTIISVFIGCFVGCVSGFFGGMIDNILMRITDIFLAFPGILLAIAFSSLIGSGLDSVIIALSIFSWVSIALVSRTQVLEIKNKHYIESAKVAGVGNFKIIIKHVLPNISTILIAQACLIFSGSIIAESGLSFLGIGIQAPDASLGIMIKQGMAYMLESPHMILTPGITLLIIVLMINLFGDKLTQAIAKH